MTNQANNHQKYPSTISRAVVLEILNRLLLLTKTWGTTRTVRPFPLEIMFGWDCWFGGSSSSWDHYFTCPTMLCRVEIHLLSTKVESPVELSENIRFCCHTLRKPTTISRVVALYSVECESSIASFYPSPAHPHPMQLQLHASGGGNSVGLLSSLFVVPSLDQKKNNDERVGKDNLYNCPTPPTKQ